MRLSIEVDDYEEMKYDECINHAYHHIMMQSCYWSMFHQAVGFEEHTPSQQLDLPTIMPYLSNITSFLPFKIVGWYFC